MTKEENSLPDPEELLKEFLTIRGKKHRIIKLPNVMTENIQRKKLRGFVRKCNNAQTPEKYDKYSQMFEEEAGKIYMHSFVDIEALKKTNRFEQYMAYLRDFFGSDAEEWYQGNTNDFHQTRNRCLLRCFLSGGSYLLIFLP